ncbi:hypothetical protein K438DRAFT_1965686 [Mycena galopus ATCC 62051]|nr:hypothetical protein K438DRAFT_1965686 [Mycena galopus ATCC 62051]
MTLPYAPTTSTEIVDWHYTLVLVVPFPGSGNDLKFEMLLPLHAGAACPPPPISAPDYLASLIRNSCLLGRCQCSIYLRAHHVWDGD